MGPQTLPNEGFRVDGVRLSFPITLALVACRVGLIQRGVLLFFCVTLLSLCVLCVRPMYTSSVCNISRFSPAGWERGADIYMVHCLWLPSSTNLA